MSAQIEVLTRDPDIIGVAEGLGIPLATYVAMVAEFIEHPDQEVTLKLLDEDPTHGVDEVVAWVRRKLASTFGDSFSRARKKKKLW